MLLCMCVLPAFHKPQACTHESHMSFLCAHVLRAFKLRVTCTIIHYVTYLFTVRLVDGSSYNEGRVEVYYSGRWGTVCNVGWTDKYASLVCAQLGIGSSGELADFGAGRESILLETIMCSLNDTIPASCVHYGVGITVKCNHNDVVGVKCYGE